jgi:GNAT superfamily N-acetyltransferase
MCSYARHLPPGLALRPRTDADLAFLSDLYASTRAEELAPVPWSPEQKRAFLDDQFGKQHAHYLEHYPNAQWYVIEHAGVPVGRFYVSRLTTEMRLMDVSLVAQWRGRGVGSALLHGLVDEADAAGLALSLHVEPYNPALRLYGRWGFEKIESRGAYLYMERALGTARPPATK